MYTAWRGFVSEMTISGLPAWFSTTHFLPCSHSVLGGLLAAGFAGALLLPDVLGTSAMQTHTSQNQLFDKRNQG